MLQNDKIQKLWQIAEPVALELGYEIIEIEIDSSQGYKAVRFYLECQDYKEAIRFEDCAKFSRAIEDLLEVKAIIEGAYNLEVSSPGMDRPLRKKEHFDRFLGQNVKVKMDLDFANQNQRKNFIGLLKARQNEVIQLITEDKQEWNLPLNQMVKAQLVSNF